MEVTENENLIGSINGTVVGGATLVEGKMGLALYINGVDQYVDFGCQGDTCLGSISLCAHGWVTAFWMRGDRPQVIMDTGLYGLDRVVIRVHNSKDLYARFDTVDKFWDVSTRLLFEQVWIHLVITWQPYYGAKLYVNGELTVTDTSPSNPRTIRYNMPRCVLGATNKYTHMSKMALDELRVWDTVMSDEEVLALYTVDARLNWDLH